MTAVYAEAATAADHTGVRRGITPFFMSGKDGSLIFEGY